MNILFACTKYKLESQFYVHVLVKNLHTVLYQFFSSILVISTLTFVIHFILCLESCLCNILFFYSYDLVFSLSLYVIY
jgi:hypothetical protein